VPVESQGRSGAHGRDELPVQEEDPVKAASAAIFKAAWDVARADERYQAARAEHRRTYG
jgi:Domain of unknown function (DUF4385)